MSDIYDRINTILIIGGSNVSIMGVNFDIINLWTSTIRRSHTSIVRPF